MTRRDIGELRRHFRPDRVAVGTIYGCYVNGIGEIVSSIDSSLALLSQEERDSYLALLKKCLSGTMGRNLIDIEFATAQVQRGEEHQLLMRLRKEHLENPETRDELYRRIISSVDMGGENYVILLAYDAYDVPRRGRDGAELESEEVFSYLLCALCPTKELKSGLQFSPDDKVFRATVPGQVIAPTELGFLFPAFDRRSTNIYNALFYTRNSTDVHADFIAGVFHTPEPLSTSAQRGAFEAALSQELGDECGFEVLQSVNEALASRVREHKEEKSDEPLLMASEELGELLDDCGVSEKAVKAFTERCRDTLGDGAAIRPENVIDSKHLVIRTGEVTITVAPEESHRLETRVIDGREYFLVPVGQTVEINGVETSPAALRLGKDKE